MAITKRESAALAKRAAEGGGVFEYAPAPESIDHIKIQPRYGLFLSLIHI